MLTRAFRARIHREGDTYVAVCEETGAASRGYTLGEALANLASPTEPYVPRRHAARAPVVVTVTMFEAETRGPNGNEDGSVASS